MATLDNSLKYVIERFLKMQIDYVLDFPNDTFADS